MIWSNNVALNQLDDTDDESVSSDEEIPIWIRGDQRWISGITHETTCQDIIQVLLQDEELRGHHVGCADTYHITERWRGVEQPLDPLSSVLSIWNTWGAAQSEVKLSLRRMKQEREILRRPRCRSAASSWSDRSMCKTIHPKRLQTMQNEKPSTTEELLKLVLAQGEVIRKQLKKLRYSEHQIGYLEDKAHRARVRKHGSNYLLETYLKSLSEAVDPDLEETCTLDKNSDSGVMTEADSEQSNNIEPCKPVEVSLQWSCQSSEKFNENIKDDDTSSTLSESTLSERIELLQLIVKLNKRLLKEEETLVMLDTNLWKYERRKLGSTNFITLRKLRDDMAKSAAEMQRNQIVLEDVMEELQTRRKFLENIYADIVKEDEEYDMLQLKFCNGTINDTMKHQLSNNTYTKDLFDTLV